MLNFLLCLLAFTLKWVRQLLARLKTRFLNPGWQQTHEVLVVNQVSVLVHNGNRHNVIVCINLVHQSTHHHQTLLRLNDLLLTLNLFRRLWLLLIMLLAHSLKGTCHQKLSVGTFAVRDHKSLSFMLDFIPDLLDQLLVQNLVD